MGIFIGREELIEAKSEIHNYNSNVIKGIEAELWVGDKLTKHLPEDTFIVTHPQIGKYCPDFIVFSPTFGIRIVEVKNWNIQNVKKIYSNGTFQFHHNNANPLEQVRLQAECCNKYLISNYQIDIYNNIGYLVIHCGFGSKDIENFKRGWEKTQRQFFDRTNICGDQIDKNIGNILKNAIKTQNESKGMSPDLIRALVNDIQFEEISFEEDELYRITEYHNIEIQKLKKQNQEILKIKNYKPDVDVLKRKTDILEKQIISITENMVETPKKTQPSVDKGNIKEKTSEAKSNSPAKTIFTVVLAFVVLCVGIMLLWDGADQNEDIIVGNDISTSQSLDISANNNKISNQAPTVQDSISKEQTQKQEKQISYSNPTISSIKSDGYLGQSITLTAKAERFSYHKNSGTKFIMLSDETGTIDGVVFKNVNIPYITVGQEYTVIGKVSLYEGSYQILIEKIW